MDFRMGKNNVWVFGKLILVFFFALFFLCPLILILMKALESGQGSSFISIIFDNSRLLWNSFYQAFLSTLVSVLIGVPAAFLIARRDFKGKKILKSLALIPFVFPSILVVLSFIIIFGNNGWINNLLQVLGIQKIQFLYGFTGIILAHSFYNFPLIMRFVSDSWEKLDRDLKDAAKTLGANKLQVFFRITLPRLMPAILSSAALVFIFTFMSFTIVITLGGIMFTTFETEIYRQITRNLNFELAAVLSIFQFLLLAGVIFVYQKFAGHFIVREKGVFEKPKKINFFSAQGVVEAGTLLTIILFIALPLLSLIVFAFVDASSEELSLRAFEKIFSGTKSLTGTTATQSIFFSLLIGLFSSLIAVTIGLLAALKKTAVKGLGFILSASLGLSAITLGFGFYLGFGSGLLWPIIIGHSLIAFPFTFRIISNALNKIDDETIESAKTLGANDFEVLKKIQIPKIKNSLLTALLFGFAVSLGELGFILVLYDGVYATMPVYIFRLLSTFDLAAATAMGLILVTISFLSFYSIESLSNEAVF